MPGNNKKGKRKQKELMNLKIASGNVSSREGLGPPPAAEVKDDNISNLKELNQLLSEQIEKFREENVILSEYLTRMNSQIEAEKKMKEELKEAERELRKELAQKEEEHEAAISKADTQLQEAKHQIYVKENDKNKIEATVLQLKDQIQVISTESDARLKAWDLEKDKLRGLSEELAKKEQEHEAAISKVRTRLQEAEQKIQLKENECTAVVFDKNKLEASVLHLEDQIQVISRESDARHDARELEKNELLSQVLAARDESKEAQKELRKELAKKGKEHEAARSKVRIRFQEVAQEIQAKENECTTAIFGKNKLQASVLMHLKDQIQVISAESDAIPKAWELEKANPLSAERDENEAITKGSQVAEQARNEAVNQDPYISLHAEGVKKYRELEEKHKELLNEKEEQENIIESLQPEIASVRREKSLISKNLDETTKMSPEKSEKCLQNDQKVLELEGQLLGLQTELAAAKSAYDEVNVELKNIRQSWQQQSQHMLN